MIENVLVFIIVSLLVYSSDKKRAIGWLVLFYYAVYIIIEVDFFGLTFGDVYTSHDHFVRWYISCTAISLVFFLSSLVIYIETKNKVAIFYSCWIVFDIAITGLSAIFQAYKTNDMILLYNTVQSVNLFMDLLVVVIGTDNAIRRTKHAAVIIDIVNYYISSWGDLANKMRGRYIKCKKR